MFGVGKVEAASIMAIEMDDMIHRINDIVDGYDIEFSTFYPDQWHPGRQYLA